MSRRTGTILVSMVVGPLALAFLGCTKDEVVAEEVVVEPSRTQTVGAADERTATAPRSKDADAKNPEGDNSDRNRDEVTETTADDQSNDKSDVETTRRIRRSLTQDGDLSTYAHNVKIITEDGRVVLKGPVRTVAEKALVEKRARDIAGATKVTSELVVTPR